LTFQSKDEEGNQQQIVYDKKTGIILKNPNDDVNYLGWKTGVLVFEPSDLESVVFDLNRNFHSKISIENEVLKSCEINATFEQKSLDSILKIIEKTLNLKVEKKGDEFIFSGQVCN